MTAINAQYIDGAAELAVARPAQAINWQYVDGALGGDLAGSDAYTSAAAPDVVINWIQDFY
jgi:hypothetical protein